MKPKVLIGCPVHESKDYSLEPYLEAIKNLTYENFEVLFVDNSDTDKHKKKIEKAGYKVIKGPAKGNSVMRIVDSRNILRNKFLEGKYDYLLSLEEDVIPPSNVIEILMGAKVPINAGLYFNIYANNFGQQEIKPLAYMGVTEEEFDVLKTDKKYEGTEIRKKIESGKVKTKNDIHSQLSAREVMGNKLIQVLYTGLGCMLIKREVLEKIAFRATEKSFDDYAFCIDAQTLGYKVWLDTTAKCDHLFKEKKDDWSKNAG